MKKLYNSFKQSKWFPLVMGIFFAICGIICMMNPQGQMEQLALYAGVVFLIYGLGWIVVGIRSKDDQKHRITSLVIGAVVVILAILDFANLPLIGKYLPTLFGFAMILTAILDMLRTVTLKQSGQQSWWIGIIPAVVVLVLGFVFLFQPGFVGKSFGIFFGITLLIIGISSLISFFQLRN